MIFTILGKKVRNKAEHHKEEGTNTTVPFSDALFFALFVSSRQSFHLILLTLIIAHQLVLQFVIAPKEALFMTIKLSLSL